MVPYTDQFPGCTVIVRSSGLARYISFEMSLEGLNVPIGSHIARAITANLAGSLNDCIKNSSSPYFWFIDDDHQFENMMLVRLMAHDKPVVNGLTCMNKPPFHTVVYQGEIERGDEKWSPDFRKRAIDLLASHELEGAQSNDESAYASRLALLEDLVRTSGYRRKNKQYMTYSWKMFDAKSGLVPVFACGLAGLLVKREVFEAIPYPWFELGQTNPEEIGEDTYFCEKVRNSKYAIETADGLCAAYIDLDLVFGHTAPATAWPTRMENGIWTIRLMWENGENIVINRPDQPPVHIPTDEEIASSRTRSTGIIERAKQLQTMGMSESLAFQKAMEEAMAVDVGESR